MNEHEKRRQKVMRELAERFRKLTEAMCMIARHGNAAAKVQAPLPFRRVGMDGGRMRVPGRPSLRGRMSWPPDYTRRRN